MIKRRPCPLVGTVFFPYFVVCFFFISFLVFSNRPLTGLGQPPTYRGQNHKQTNTQTDKHTDKHCNVSTEKYFKVRTIENLKSLLMQSYMSCSMWPKQCIEHCFYGGVYIRHPKLL